MLRIVVSAVVWLFAVVAAAEQPLQELVPESFPHSTLVLEEGPSLVDYQLGLGAMQKIGGRWRHKEAEQIDGELLRRTWEVTPDYTSAEAFEFMQQQLAEQTQLLFECEGRSCGSSAQWASRVFHQRLLYGHDERQQYLAARRELDGVVYTYVLYAVDRANRRHYIHLDLIRQQ